MILPTIHMNGTSRVDLMDDYLKVRRALLAAETTLVQNGPNARDYYPQGPAAFAQATLEHLKRFSRLKEISAEIEEIIEHIDRAG